MSDWQKAFEDATWEAANDDWDCDEDAREAA